VKYSITRTQYLEAMKAAESFGKLDYNAVLFNCTHFAVEVGKAARVAVPYPGAIARPEVFEESLSRTVGN